MSSGVSSSGWTSREPDDPPSEYPPFSRGESATGATSSETGGAFPYASSKRVLHSLL